VPPYETFPPDVRSTIVERLLAWGQDQRPDLPWRRDRSPYRVLVAEVMLQQTQAATVASYYERFLARFPTVGSLAAAPLADVLKQWEGMGYYARARNLHKAAQIIMAEHGGQVPDEAAALRRLPGIGRYTAGAILSLAFGQDTPALDGNMRRVLCRLFAIREAPRLPGVQRLLWGLAHSLLPPGKAGPFNEALMDLGATVCTPRSPRCPACPLLGLCEAQRQGLQENIPPKTSRHPLPHYDVTAAVIEDGEGRLLVAQRPQHKLLGGLWEFPGGKREEGETLEECLARELREELGVEVVVGEEIMSFPHAYTHFRITLHVFRCRIVSGTLQPLAVAAVRWAGADELKELAFARTDRRILETMRHI
jgi:A/G-specific adenine glycosylase